MEGGEEGQGVWRVYVRVFVQFPSVAQHDGVVRGSE